MAAQKADAAQDAAQSGGTPQWRPLLHYTPHKYWMNDPNGPVFYKGVYHLFYQYNPMAAEWGNMSWGHATSTDLLHWHEHEVAMASRHDRDIFSGSVVIDRNNTSGLGTAENPAMVALYTSVFKAGTGHRPGIQAQSLAYSLDGGSTWRMYQKDPVLTLSPDSMQFRDPGVSWYEPGGYWVMTTVVADAPVIKLYRSDNLIDWTFLSDFGPAGFIRPGMLWEMPTLFSLPLDGDPSRRKWIMMVGVNPWSIAGGSGTAYFVGSFDGRTFHAEDLPPDGSDPSLYDWADHGADHYAAMLFSDRPGSAPLTIGWMNNWDYANTVPTEPWKGQMTLPMTLALKSIDSRPRICFTPDAHYTALVAGRRAYSFNATRLSAERRILPDSTRGEVLDIDLQIHGKGARTAGIILRASPDEKTGTRIVYDFEHHTLSVDRARSGRTDFSPRFSAQHIVNMPHASSISVHIIVDRNSVEVLALEGSVVITDLIFPPADADHVIAFAEGGSAEFTKLQVTPLDDHGTHD
ncbi:glycoside hydrolase family 32 protein [Komagataeibacter sp. FNDCR2]|uniref:glycoside hydrolase family 32 protein n=1 Tax=Komagataeibacter sp. FNDCR2 TaxID=2878682 RepID=UPI001E64F4E1|nr:glycoside hydrolase family 32 protein [Komagataeibacter sp. FNDCR2]MCE2574236.1 glycoside hydrolase family 32 protein [Komagataeibacter sp. FNDCR2]